MSKYVATVGIETHVQLRTKTKLFSAVDNDARLAEPNTLISHIDVGLPGALPVLNQKAVELTVRAGLALNGDVQQFSKFDRKHYFYPDLPKGYQITQYDQPLVLGGHVDICLDANRNCRVGIIRIHLEEDAGKTTHPAGADYSLVDLNRAGTPLIEIVSQPDIHSPAEAKAYARELWLIMKYAGVTDGDLYHGHVRFDVNISLSNDPAKLGTRSEVKNLNSFRSVEGAVAYEIKRQTELLEKGEKVAQETRGWDEAKQKTTSQRGKEEAEDYRYMPEPDIPPVELDQAFITQIRRGLPNLPANLRQKLNKLNIAENVIEDLLDRPASLAQALDVFEQAGAEPARLAVFWALHAQPNQLDKSTFENNQFDISVGGIVELAEMVISNKLNSTAAQRIYNQLSTTDETPMQLAEKLNLIQVSDESAIEKIVLQVIKDNPKVVEDIKAGQEKAVGFLVGQVMSQSKGQANPELAQKIIRRLI